MLTEWGLLYLLSKALFYTLVTVVLGSVLESMKTLFYNLTTQILTHVTVVVGSVLESMVQFWAQVHGSILGSILGSRARPNFGWALAPI